MAKCFITKFLGEIDNDNLPIYDTFVIHVTPNVASAENLAARIINFQSPKDIVISTKDGGNHIAYVVGDWVPTEPTNITNKVTVPANTKAGVYMKDDTEYDVLVSGLYSFTYIGSTNGGSSVRAFNFNINQLSNSTNLQTLHIVNGAQISGDIANLKGLINLQTLSLNGCNVSGDIAELKTLVNSVNLGLRPYVKNAIAGDVKEVFDAMAKTNRNNKCRINWEKTACIYSGDTSMTPAKRFITATFNGNGGYTVENYQEDR